MQHGIETSDWSAPLPSYALHTRSPVLLPFLSSFYASAMLFRNQKHELITFSTTYWSPALRLC
eukprot:3578533-Rhodomonas_salina.1